MKLNIKVRRKINLRKANGCEHPNIDPIKHYFVNYNGNWIYGKFFRQWYGWNFDWFGSVYSGLPLDSLTEIWEVKIDETRRVKKK